MDLGSYRLISLNAKLAKNADDELDAVALYIETIESSPELTKDEIKEIRSIIQDEFKHAIMFLDMLHNRYIKQREIIEALVSQLKSLNIPVEARDYNDLRCYIVGSNNRRAYCYVKE